MGPDWVLLHYYECTKSLFLSKKVINRMYVYYN